MARRTGVTRPAGGSPTPSCPRACIALLPRLHHHARWAGRLLPPVRLPTVPPPPASVGRRCAARGTVPGGACDWWRGRSRRRQAASASSAARAAHAGRLRRAAAGAGARCGCRIAGPAGSRAAREPAHKGGQGACSRLVWPMHYGLPCTQAPAPPQVRLSLAPTRRQTVRELCGRQAGWRLGLAAQRHWHRLLEQAGQRALPPAAAWSHRRGGCWKQPRPVGQVMVPGCQSQPRGRWGFGPRWQAAPRSCGCGHAGPTALQWWACRESAPLVQ